ncbi:hypothetical protein [Streptococcus oriscaviae]
MKELPKKEKLRQKQVQEAKTSRGHGSKDKRRDSPTSPALKGDGFATLLSWLEN